MATDGEHVLVDTESVENIEIFIARSVGMSYTTEQEVSEKLGKMSKKDLLEKILKPLAHAFKKQLAELTNSHNKIQRQLQLQNDDKFEKIIQEINKVKK